jgi:hypothetical protein
MIYRLRKSQFFVLNIFDFKGISIFPGKEPEIYKRNSGSGMEYSNILPTITKESTQTTMWEQRMNLRKAFVYSVNFSKN